jgi:hypothetical protein
MKSAANLMPGSYLLLAQYRDVKAAQIVELSTRPWYERGDICDNVLINQYTCAQQRLIVITDS